MSNRRLESARSREQPARRETRWATWYALCGTLALAAAFSVGFAQTPALDSASGSFATLIRSLVAQPAASTSSRRSSPREERALLERLYGAAREQPLWTRDGRPSSQAAKVMNVLDRAEAHGLRASDYDVDLLRSHSAQLEAGSLAPTSVARFDVALSRAVIRMLSDLHRGRVDPRTVGFDLPHQREQLDLAAVALDVSRAGNVDRAMSGVAPVYAGYAALERSLARYRALASDATLRPPAALPRSVRAGDRYADAGALRRFLAALGDLAPEDAAAADAPDSVYGGALVDAVEAFQRRHGLDADGVLGRATLAQLRVPLTQRVRQIELTLERWRWLPDRPPPRYAVVNVPAFRVYLFENDSTAREPSLAMNVIVGQAEGRHWTPVFAGEMREVVFRPYWDVPPRIARNELVPAIRRNPGYLDREALEIVSTGGGEQVYSPTSANLARVSAGTLRLRQRPGPGNSLGLVKFVFPNDYSVYLHGTPAQGLFARSRRDFSHGCIRAEDPTALAELVLRGQPGWDRASIEAAMNGARTLHVRVARPVMVYVLYATVDARDDVTFFYPDLYGRDATLARALALPPLAALDARTVR